LKSVLIVATQRPAPYFVQTHAALLPRSIKIDTDPVMDSLEIVGFLVAEPQIHATEVSTRGQRELAQYEDFFDIKRGNKKKKIKQDSMCDATHGGGTSTSDSTNRPDMTRKYDKSC
jgi:hypothetical protein